MDLGSLNLKKAGGSSCLLRGSLRDVCGRSAKAGTRIFRISVFKKREPPCIGIGKSHARQGSRIIQALAKSNSNSSSSSSNNSSSSSNDQAGTRSAQTSASSHPPKCDDRGYDVFLNFRGPDSRHTVVDVLYKALIRAGISVFYDDEEIRKGEVIAGELLSAITNSKIYITIFSKGYACSKWCLREIAYMVDLKKKSMDGDEKMILPVFCDVDASDVKLKTELYRDALQKHEKESGEDVAKQWEEALREVGQIKGFNLKDHGLDELTKLIVEVVCDKLWTRSERKVPDDLVGIQDSVKNILRLLGEDTNDVRFVIIHGMSGIGKTTLAKIVFDIISLRFHKSCVFLSNVRESSSSVGGMVNLQRELLHGTLNLKSLDIRNDDDGANMIKERLKDKEVLIVLDDLDNSDQLAKLAGAVSWFGKGSRIIITTKNIDHLVGKHEDFYFLEVQVMQPDDALKFFSKLAFKSDSPPPDYDDISRKIVHKTGGLPLAIKVIGNLLCHKGKKEWEDRLEKLERVVQNDVRKKLMISYEDLDHYEKEIFLDIACLFINEEKTNATYYWEARGLFPKSGINVLINRSLIKIADDDRIWMHDLLRDLGRNIVDEETGGILERRSRLWSPKEALDVIRKKKGCGDVVALKLGGFYVDHHFTLEPFAKLTNLNFLEVDGFYSDEEASLSSIQNFSSFANEEFDGEFLELKWLSLRNCGEFKASNFHFENLAVLKVSFCDLKEITAAPNLKVLDCKLCRFQRPFDFSAFPKLERLILRYCSLEEIDPTIGKLEHLDYLEIRDIGKEEDCIIPVSTGGLKSQVVLKLLVLKSSVLHASMGELVNLKRLRLWCEALTELPDWVGKLTSLVELDISRTLIVEVPECVKNRTSLKVIPSAAVQSVGARRMNGLVGLVGKLRSKWDT